MFHQMFDIFSSEKFIEKMWFGIFGDSDTGIANLDLDGFLGSF